MYIKRKYQKEDYFENCFERKKFIEYDHKKGFDEFIKKYLIKISSIKNTNFHTTGVKHCSIYLLCKVW